MAAANSQFSARAVGARDVLLRYFDMYRGYGGKEWLLSKYDSGIFRLRALGSEPRIQAHATRLTHLYPSEFIMFFKVDSMP